jgi:hypothetical protein
MKKRPYAGKTPARPRPPAFWTIACLEALRPGEALVYYRGRREDLQRGRLQPIANVAKRLAKVGKIELHTEPVVIACADGSSARLTKFVARGVIPGSFPA